MEKDFQELINRKKDNQWFCVVLTVLTIIAICYAIHMTMWVLESDNSEIEAAISNTSGKGGLYVLLYLWFGEKGIIIGHWIIVIGGFLLCRSVFRDKKEIDDKIQKLTKYKK